MSLYDDQVQRHMRPSKVGELELEVASFEVGDEEDESDDVQDEADKSVVRSEWK